jgi:hypothetical protein
MRKGISLIELVLAIVVIAISVMTVPMMLQQGTKSDTFSMMQEAILAARTKMGNILSYQWDDHSRESNNTNGRLRALDVANGDPALDRNGTYYPERRIGHVYGDLRRKMKPAGAANLFPKPGADANITDINDFDNLSSVITWSGVSTASDRYDYLDKDLNLTTKVYFVSDKLVTGSDYNDTTLTFVFDPSVKTSITHATYSTNIKMVELNVTSKSYPTFLFRTFSCNLGETNLLEKEIN